MKPAQAKKRDQIIQQLWDAQDNASQEDAPEVLSAARTAISKLEALLKAENELDDPGHTGKTYKFLGDAYYTLAAGRDQESFATACKMYLQGERLLESAADQTTLAKLNFNLGNAYRKLGAGFDRANMEEARRRYNNARKLFTATQPDAVPTVLSSLQDLEVAIRALDMYEVAAREKDRAQKLREQLEQAGADPDPEFMRSIQGEIDKMSASANKDAWKMSDLLRQTNEVSDTSEKSSSDAEENIRSLMGFINEDASDEQLKSRQADEELFGMAFQMLDDSVAKGEATKGQADDLRSILEQFKGIASRSAETPLELNAKYTDMKEFVDRYKKSAKTPRPGKRGNK